MKTPEQIESELIDILGEVAAPFPAPEWAVDKIIELFKSNRLTDEQIDAMFPVRDIDAFTSRSAARQVRDLLQSKGGEGL